MDGVNGGTENTSRKVVVRKIVTIKADGTVSMRFKIICDPKEVGKAMIAQDMGRHTYRSQILKQI